MNIIELVEPLNVRVNSQQDKYEFIWRQRRRAPERPVLKYPIALVLSHLVDSFTLLSNEFNSRSSSSLDSSSGGDVRCPQVVPLVDDVEDDVDLFVHQSAVDFGGRLLNESSGRRFEVRVVEVR